MESFRKTEQLGGQNAGTETRSARLALLRGDNRNAEQHLATALVFLRNLSEPLREAIAWCQWQLGEIAFSTGNYEKAERHYREALATVPNDFRALSSLGRLDAARGESTAAIRYLAEAVRIAPSIDSMAALADLYQLPGRSEEAAARYELVAQLGEHTQKTTARPTTARWQTSTLITT